MILVNHGFLTCLFYFTSATVKGILSTLSVTSLEVFSYIYHNTNHISIANLSSFSLSSPQHSRQDDGNKSFVFDVTKTDITTSVYLEKILTT